MRRSIRTIAMSGAAAALVLSVVTGCGQARPEGQSEKTIVQTEEVPAVTEAPIVIQTEAPQTEKQTEPQTQPQTQAPETQAPETQAPETQAPETQTAAPTSLSKDEELNQYYEYTQEEQGVKYANTDVNVRVDPTTDEDNVLESLIQGEDVTVLAETANWYKIYRAENTENEWPELTGYVMKAYLSDTYDEAMAAQPSETAAPAEAAPAEAAPAEAAPAEAAPAEAAPAETSAPVQQVAASGPQVTVISDANIRSSNSETADVVGIINAGTTVTQVSTTGDGWVEVNSNGVQGYIKASMIG